MSSLFFLLLLLLFFGLFFFLRHRLLATLYALAYPSLLT
jgi:hypothetical protein